MEWNEEAIVYSFPRDDLVAFVYRPIEDYEIIDDRHNAQPSRHADDRRSPPDIASTGCPPTSI